MDLSCSICFKQDLFFSRIGYVTYRNLMIKEEKDGYGVQTENIFRCQSKITRFLLVPLSHCQKKKKKKKKKECRHNGSIRQKLVCSLTVSACIYSVTMKTRSCLRKRLQCHAGKQKQEGS